MADENAYPSDRSPFRRDSGGPLYERAFPVSADVRAYRPHTFQRDVVAGLTVAALAIPSGMAFAEVVGLPPVAGLYALLLPVVGYVLLGSSKRLMIGPEGSVSALVGAALAPIAATEPERALGAASALALLVGACFFLARLLRMGWIADYFSRPVLIGYIHGVAIVLIVGQLGKLVGFSVSADEPGAQVVEVITSLNETSVTTLAVGLVCLVALFALKHWLPKLPAALVVVVVAIAASAVFDFASHGVSTVGEIPPGLPSFVWPGLRADELAHLVPAALGIFVVSFADAILTARSFAGRHHEHVRANQELAAFAGASVAAGVMQSFSIGASGSRTAVADDMGARTQIAALCGATTVALVLLFLTEPMEYLPSTTLAAVIIYAAVGLVDIPAWRALVRQSGRETFIATVTLVGVIAVGVLPALIVAVALSILDVVSRSARPHDAVLGYVPRLGRWADVRVHPSAVIEPGMVVYRLDDRLFFANASYVKARIREALAGSPTAVQWLVFDAESVVEVDATGLEAIQEIVTSLRAEGVSFALARSHGGVLDTLESEGILESIGTEHVYPTVHAAVTACRRA